MNCGWHDDNHFILFNGEESDEFGPAYGFPDFLPGFRVAGVFNCDDFIVTDSHSSAFTVPTVPLNEQHLKPFHQDFRRVELTQDSRTAGKIKWYLNPIVFGGDPQLDSNIQWVNVGQHTALVKWWNQKYREIKASAGSTADFPS